LAKARHGQRVLVHGAAGGVGSALLQLAKLAGVEMYGTCSAQGSEIVRELGGIPIDYKNADFVNEIRRLTGDGVDAVFDGIGGDNLRRSRDALREGGRVVSYGFQGKMRGGRMASGSECSARSCCCRTASGRKLLARAGALRAHLRCRAAA